MSEDYIKCVANTHIDNKGKSWCGRNIANEWAFSDSEHAALNGSQKGRLMVCSKCKDKIIEALNNGY